ncbi:hypothetical protein H6P81_013882 [Aristolochia fimbriata]|uniref:Uncharacterized protein n=1 Tax=Aristolochia fimbriata TaxID=158543 RepID=A0AAV7EGE6_ARIFI|nr:hypothetical protein H6P81_013882 [Aristolochia fimbriata]
MATTISSCFQQPIPHGVRRRLHRTTVQIFDYRLYYCHVRIHTVVCPRPDDPELDRSHSVQCSNWTNHLPYQCFGDVAQSSTSLCINLPGPFEPSTVHTPDFAKSMSAYLKNINQIIDNLTAFGEPHEDQTVTHFVVNVLGPNFELFAQTVTGQVEPLNCRILIALPVSLSMLLHGAPVAVVAVAVDVLRKVAVKPIRMVVAMVALKLIEAIPQIAPLSDLQQKRTFYHTMPQPIQSELSTLAHPTMWDIDYGALHHITSDLSLLTDSGSYTGLDQAMLGNSSRLPIYAIGTGDLTQSLPL